MLGKVQIASSLAFGTSDPRTGMRNFMHRPLQDADGKYRKNASPVPMLESHDVPMEHSESKYILEHKDPDPSEFNNLNLLAERKENFNKELKPLLQDDPAFQRSQAKIEDLLGKKQKPAPKKIESKLKQRTGMQILTGLKSNFDAAVEAAEKAGLDAKNLEALRKLPKFLMTLLLNSK